MVDGLGAALQDRDREDDFELEGRTFAERRSVRVGALLNAPAPEGREDGPFDPNRSRVKSISSLEETYP